MREKTEPLGTICETDDALWELIRPLRLRY